MYLRKWLFSILFKETKQCFFKNNLSYFYVLTRGSLTASFLLPVCSQFLLNLSQIRKSIRIISYYVPRRTYVYVIFQNIFSSRLKCKISSLFTIPHNIYIYLPSVYVYNQRKILFFILIHYLYETISCWIFLSLYLSCIYKN